MCRKLARVALATIVVLGIVNEALAQRGRFGFGGTRGPASLVSLAANEAVQKDLGVAEVDARQLRELNDAYRRAINDRMEGGGFDFEALRELTEEERRAVMAEFAKKREQAAAQVNKEFEEKLATIISPEEIGRLRQIRLQSQGAEALFDAEVGDQLALNEEQRKRLSDIRSEYASRLGGGFSRRDRERGGQGGFERIRTLTAERDAKLLEVLTADQQQKFDQLKGYPFDVSQLRGQRGN